MLDRDERIRANPGNMNKILDTIEDPNNKKKKPGQDECFEESTDDAPLEYFTE